MGKNPTSDVASHRKHYDNYSISVRKDEGVKPAVMKAAARMGIPQATYIVIAIKEKLRRDGFEIVDKKDKGSLISDFDLLNKLR